MSIGVSGRWGGWWGWRVGLGLRWGRVRRVVRRWLGGWGDGGDGVSGKVGRGEVAGYTGRSYSA